MEPDEMRRTLNRFVIEDIKVDGFIFTMGAADGLTDVWNGNDEILGVEGLERIVRKTATGSLHDMREAVIEGVNSYSAGPLRDDVTLILAEIR
jgi:serine phosphatase RsbU (regulator of sigma subunit)